MAMQCGRIRWYCAVIIIAGCFVTRAGDVKPGDLKSADEITKIYALAAIAREGKNARVSEADVVALMTKSWEGRRLAKWCMHALVSMGVPGDKYMDAFHAAAFWEDKANRPHEVEDRKRTEPAWRKLIEGPELPEELKQALPEVWKTVTNVVLTGFERGEVNASWRYRECIQRMQAPKELMIPRLGKFLGDQKQNFQLRANAAESIMFLRRSPLSTDALIIGFSDTDPRVRRSCINAIVAIGLEVDAYGSVMSGFKHPEPEKAIAALEKVVATDADAGLKDFAARSMERIKKGQ